MLLILVCPTVLHKYDLGKYVNTFKERNQTSVNKHNLTYGMCYYGMRYVLFSFQLMAKKFYLTGDMTNLYLFIQGSLERPFSELFISNVSL